ncbi:MAG: hypothetical protein IT291_02465 [Deltaproteobacteria bacterium]|nr:hypothetical protein [Deltaproteobacteria bacterium]
MLSPTMPTVGVGDVVNFGVRRNIPGNRGIISINGQLVQANLPLNIKAGSKILAQVAEIGPQVLLKILQAQGPTTSSRIDLATQLANEIANSLSTASLNHLKLQSSLLLPMNLDSSAWRPELLKSLMGNISNNAELYDSNALLANLFKLTNGTFSSWLKSLLDQTQTTSLNSPFGTLQPLPGSLLTALEAELRAMLGQASDFSSISKHLKHILDVISKDFSQKETLNSKDAQVLQNVLRDLKTATQNEEHARLHIQAAFSQLEEFLHNNAKLTTTSASMSEAQFKQAILGLEQLANTQETLNRLNPLMQALGEPALIMFPFLFQNFISHGEVIIDPDRQNKGSKQKSSDGSTHHDEGLSNGEAYRHIHINLTLPTLGQTIVDIAHRKHEILVRFTLDDEEKAEFLAEQLDFLSAILRSSGFEKTEFIASSNPNPENSTAWFSRTLDRFLAMA